jgi:hypothetical protein
MPAPLASRPPSRPLVGAAAIVVTVAAGSVVDVLMRGHTLVENLIAAIMLGAFVIGIAWIDSRMLSHEKTKTPSNTPGALF